MKLSMYERETEGVVPWGTAGVLPGLSESAKERDAKLKVAKQDSKF